MNLLRRHHTLTQKDHPLSDDFKIVNQLIQSGKIIDRVNQRIKLF